MITLVAPETAPGGVHERNRIEGERADKRAVDAHGYYSLYQRAAAGGLRAAKETILHARNFLPSVLRMQYLLLRCWLWLPLWLLCCL